MKLNVYKYLSIAALLMGSMGCNVDPGGGSNSGACTSTDNAGPCTGTFPCGNSGIHGVCDRATQVCVVSPGSVNCETIPGASATNCPSLAAAGSVAGCTAPFTPMCTGSSADGITVQCSN